MNTGSEITYQPKSLDEARQLSSELASSPLMPVDLRGKKGDVLIIIMTGAELGLPPMQSIRSVSVIKGKPSLSADLMVALCKRRPDVCESLVLVEASEKVATYRAKHVGEPETVMSFTMADAQAAGLAGQDMYKKYPKQMLRARCASLICRAIFPELMMGVYDADSGELTDGVVPPTAPPAPPPPPAPVARLERATEDAATEVPGEPPASVALPSGPPPPKTPEFDRHFEAELLSAKTIKELRAIGAKGNGKVLDKHALNMVFLRRQGELNRGAH